MCSILHGQALTKAPAHQPRLHACNKGTQPACSLFIQPLCPGFTLKPPFVSFVFRSLMLREAVTFN